jgi:hypothetical protein
MEGTMRRKESPPGRILPVLMAALGLALAAVPPHASRGGETPRVVIVAFGVYSLSPWRGKLPPQYRQDTISEVRFNDMPLLVQQTDRIEARACTRFGLQYRADNLPPGEAAPITVRVEHPRVARPDGRSSTIDTYEVPSGGGVRYTGFDFDEPWTLVPGTWTFSLIHGGEVLAEQRFAIIIAPGTTIPPEGCVPAVA